MRKEQLWGFLLAMLAVAGIAGGIVLSRQNKIFSFSDTVTGISASIRSSYHREFREYKEASQEKKLVAHFVRTDPAALITLRYETGIRKASALLRRNPIEHFTYEIRQFFPIKYAGYKSELLETRKIAGKDGLEHIFQYTDKDGTLMKTRLLIVPWDEDIAYYLILQAKERDFRKVASDLDILRKSVQLSGPQIIKLNEDIKP